MIDTQVLDVWFQDAFGVDPAAFPANRSSGSDAANRSSGSDAAGQSSGSDAAGQSPGSDAAGQSSAPGAPGQSSAPGAGGQPSNADALKIYQAEVAAATKLLTQAGSRIVAPGKAAEAKASLPVAYAAIRDAFKAGNNVAALAHLREAEAAARVVMAAPDPAMLPVTPGKHPDQALYQTERGDARNVAETDVHQGGIGDCYLLSSIGEIARLDPAKIKHMIKDNGNGTYTVTLHQATEGGQVTMGAHPPHKFKEVKVTVDGNFAAGTVNSGPGQDQVGSKKEIWVQVIEKAYAKLHGGYDKIDGGYASNAMETLTGKDANLKWMKDVTLAQLQDDIAHKRPVVLGTLAGKDDKPMPPFNLVQGHAYMLDAIVVVKGKPFVKLRNPWGMKQPSLIPADKLGSAFEDVAEGSL